MSDRHDMGSRCPICKFRVDDTDAVLACSSCGVRYHEICWTSVKGCASYGCDQAPEVEKVLRLPRGRVGWGDEKRCPACNRGLQPGALSCICGAAFPAADPMTPVEYEMWGRKQAQVERAKTMLSTLFGLGVLGAPGMVTGTIALVICLSSWRMLVGQHGLYLAMGLSSFTLGLVYLLTTTLILSGF